MNIRTTGARVEVVRLPTGPPPPRSRGTVIAHRHRSELRRLKCKSEEDDRETQRLRLDCEAYLRGERALADLANAVAMLIDPTIGTDAGGKQTTGMKEQNNDYQFR